VKGNAMRNNRWPAKIIKKCLAIKDEDMTFKYYRTVPFSPLFMEEQITQNAHNLGPCQHKLPKTLKVVQSHV
jgi:hypothetical protein